jgi:hypothetical protein
MALLGPDASPSFAALQHIKGTSPMKSLIAAAALSLATALPLAAQDATMTVTQLADIATAERLIALGEARGEPLLILAALRLRATMGGAEPEGVAGMMEDEAALARARELAGGDEALTGLIDDVAAAGSRRLPICARNGFCY